MKVTLIMTNNTTTEVEFDSNKLVSTPNDIIEILRSGKAQGSPIHIGQNGTLTDETINASEVKKVLIEVEL